GFGRKKVIIPGLMFKGIGGLIAGLASWKMDQAYSMILLGRILQGIGASGDMPIVLPLVGDLFQRESVASATLGSIKTANTAGKGLSPIIDAALTAVIWLLHLWSIHLSCLISVLMVIFLIKKKNDANETPMPFKQYIKDIKDVFKNHKRWLIAVFIIGAILMFILFGFLFYLSSVLEDKFSIDGIKKGL